LLRKSVHKTIKKKEREFTSSWACWSIKSNESMQAVQGFFSYDFNACLMKNNGGNLLYKENKILINYWDQPKHLPLVFASFVRWI